LTESNDRKTAQGELPRFSGFLSYRVRSDKDQVNHKAHVSSSRLSYFSWISGSGYLSATVPPRPSYVVGQSMLAFWEKLVGASRRGLCIYLVMFREDGFADGLVQSRLFIPIVGAACCTLNGCRAIHTLLWNQFCEIYMLCVWCGVIVSRCSLALSLFCFLRPQEVHSLLLPR
jgi:hypothetical protein